MVGTFDRMSAVGTNSTTPPMSTATKVTTANWAGRDSSARCHDPRGAVAGTGTSGAASARSSATSAPRAAVR
jgi:hypothetical protein